MSTETVPQSSATSSTDKYDAMIVTADAAFKAGKWDDAAEAYTVVLEILAEKYGDFSLESADVLLKYGKTLLESGISQNIVMQSNAEAAAAENEEDEEAENLAAKALEAVASSASALSNHFVFEDEGDDDNNNHESTQDLSPAAGPSTSTGGGSNGQTEGGAPEDDTLEDDFNAAWEVLDAARTLFGKMDGPRARLQEAECLIALGDLCLETENFPQAILDFTSALTLKLALLPPSSRQLSEAHLKLGVALEFDPANPMASRPRALGECEKAKASLLERRVELVTGVSQGATTKAAAEGGSKGKGKGLESEEEEDLVKDRVEEMEEGERQREIKSIDGILTDLDVKIEDLRTAPLPSNTLPDLLPSNVRPIPASTPFGVPFASSPSSSSLPNAPVNDLSSMVKKKKQSAPPPAPAAVVVTGGKRKATDEGSEGQLVEEGGKKTKTG